MPVLVPTPPSAGAGDYDVLTLDEAKNALNIPLTDDQFDDELASFVTAVSERLDDLCGPIVQRTVTDEIHVGAVASIWPEFTPAASFSAVLEYAGGVATTLTAETLLVAGDYAVVDAGTHNSHLARRSAWANRWFTAGQVVITYVAGRYADTASVSPKFKQAAAKTLSWLWRGDQGAGTATFGAADGASVFGLGFALPNSVVELLAYEAIPTVMA